MDQTVEHNIKKCHIVLEPIIQRNGVTPVTPKLAKNKKNQNTTPQPLRSTNQYKTVTSSSLSPCFVELKNMDMRTDTKTCENSNNLLNTPRSVSKHRKPSLETHDKVKHAKSFEPVTPKAPIEFSIELKKAINDRNILTSKTKKRVFEALDEIKNKTEEERRSFKKEKALLEIINSEIKYVSQLETIIHFFMNPTKDRNLLKPDDYNILFRNIIMIYNINKELLNELDKGVGNVANAFSKIAPLLKLYSVYAYEFKSALKILQNARSLNPQFAKFVEDQETRPEVQNKFSALLITPIQRVPRYKLLLTTIYNLTKPSEVGFSTLSDCLTKIEEVAEHINKVVEDQENMQRLLEFQRCLRGEPNVITPGRKLIQEGILTKMSTKNASSEKLYVALMNDIIMFTKMKKDGAKVNSLKCLSIFPLSKCKVIEILDKGCLKIVCQNEELILYHDQFSETKKWINVVTEAIDDYLRDRKTLRKESSARRPVKRKDLHEYHEVGLSPGRPLKRRKCDEDMENEVSVPSKKILKRKPIRPVLEDVTITRSLPCSLTNPQVSFNRADKDEADNSRQVAELSKDLFVFGEPNNDTGFKFGKFFGGVGSTIKKFLGFRN